MSVVIPSQYRCIFGDDRWGRALRIGNQRGHILIGWGCGLGQLNSLPNDQQRCQHKHNFVPLRNAFHTISSSGNGLYCTDYGKSAVAKKCET